MHQSVGSCTATEAGGPQKNPTDSFHSKEGKRHEALSDIVTSDLNLNQV